MFQDAGRQLARGLAAMHENSDAESVEDQEDHDPFPFCEQQFF